jgi:hypothetical protein
VARIWESCFVMSSLRWQLWVNGPMASAADKKIDHCKGLTKRIARYKAAEGITYQILCAHFTVK